MLTKPSMAGAAPQCRRAEPTGGARLQPNRRRLVVQLDVSAKKYRYDTETLQNNSQLHYEYGEFFGHVHLWHWNDITVDRREFSDLRDPDAGAHGECIVARNRSMVPERRLDRSEEHTSELQSLMRISYAVFCLKKKQNTTRATE